MPSLFAAMHSAAESMRAFERSLSVVQNNVTNASTPGYARQVADLVALNYQPDLNLPGGVTLSGNVTSRSAYAEQTVRRQSERFGYHQQLASSLAQVEPIFDITGGTGLTGALTRLYNAFSQLAVSPNDTSARENVIGGAKDLAAGFNSAATSLATAADHNQREIRDALERINRLAGQIAAINREVSIDYRKRTDAGLDARMNAALEELSEIVDFNALREENGTVSVHIGGQTPLVLGDKTYELQADFSGAAVEILDWSGRPITSQIQAGRLKAMVDLANQLLPAYRADLDQLAAAFADRVNGILANGADLNGQPPAVNLFTYNAAMGAARTMAVTAITPSEIAAASLLAPGGNANALDLAALVGSREINNFTFTEFYGQIGAKLGKSLFKARDDTQTQALLVAQAKTLRQELSGVNLDEEAVNLMQYQRAYQAAAQLVSVLNDLTLEVVRILR
ncbi:MAG: flagellar hook-associated protein FlgK [Bryobacteraceae bacterium]|nr:flagellar hook-associated protein FlgK [Bryobacteraceae bacterium]